MGKAARKVNFILVVIAFALLACLSPALARTDVTAGAGHTPNEGVGCIFQDRHSFFPIGGVTTNEQDVPGKHGNEINNIGAVVDLDDTLLGWLYQSFNGVTMFEPLGQTNSLTFRIRVSTPSSSFNAMPWLRRAATESKRFGPQFAIQPTILSSNAKRAHVVPCFRSAWSSQ